VKLKRISKEKAQRILFIAVLVLVFGVFFISLSLLNPRETPPPGGEDPGPPIEEPEDPIVYEKIIAPYIAKNVETIRRFWALDKETEIQEMSFIVQGSSYYTSTGISYSAGDEGFEVIASLSGTVKTVSDSSVFGKVVVIEHDNGLETEYRSLGEVSVEIGDEVAQGDVIGISGENENDASAGNHLHFRILVNGKPKDPELLIGKAINEINEN
jgi:murein DD-endopeptidase MepM/ murein hydrolase activator NlpD